MTHDNPFLSEVDEWFWRRVDQADQWLDNAVMEPYRSEQPLAQDWARVSKVTEEVGEAIGELILLTGQNPRKGRDPEAEERLLQELADVVATGLLAIQHFTKDVTSTEHYVASRMYRLCERVGIDVHV